VAGKDGDGGDDDGDVEEDRDGDGGVSGDGRELDPVHDGDDDGGLRFLSICSDMAVFDRRDPRGSHTRKRVCRLCSFQDSIDSLSSRLRISRICHDGGVHE